MITPVHSMQHLVLAAVHRHHVGALVEGGEAHPRHAHLQGAQAQHLRRWVRCRWHLDMP